MPKYPKIPEQIGTLAHEAVHACRNILDKIGENSSEEILEHSVGAVVRTVLQKSRKKLKLKVKNQK